MATSNSTLNARINSLVRYVLDVKPYHTKLIGFTSEVSFNDSLQLTMSDGQPQHTIYHQNVWGSADIPSLAIVSDGTDASKLFIIPATVMPRFSSTDSIDYGQSPIGDDQAALDLADVNSDGVPDASYPWTRTPTLSHQLGANSIPVRLKLTDLTVTVTTATPTTYEAVITGSFYTAMPELCGIPFTALELRVNGASLIVDGTGGVFTTTTDGAFDPNFMAPEPSLPSFPYESIAAAFIYRSGVELWAITDTGRYAVPFHNGSKVRVNNVPQLFGAANDYFVDSSRSYIQFTASKHPAPTDRIDINLMNSDRLFISICDPFAAGPTGYDMFPYDLVPYDISANADQFILEVNDAMPGRNEVYFANTQPGTSKAELKGVLIYPSQPNGAIWQLVSDGLFSITVQQLSPIIGPIERAVINEPFDNGKIAFTLRPPWHEYYLSHGIDSYVAYDMLPFDDEYYDRLPDEADFWPGNDIKTQYGVFNDPLPPLHPPVQFIALGELKQRAIGGKPQFIFEFYDVPARGSFVELRIEQAKQLNPRLQLSMHEHLKIVQLVDSTISGPAATTIYDTDVYATHEFTAGAVIAGAADTVRVIETSGARITESGADRILES